MRVCYQPYSAHVCALVCGLLCSCGTAQAPRISPLPQHAPSETSEGLPTQLSELDHQARSGAVTDRIAGSGLVIEDPYRALETDSALTRTWRDAQTERTQRALAAITDPRTEARLQQLLEIGSLADVAIAGGRVFFGLLEPPRQRPALYVLGTHDATTTASTAKAADQPALTPQLLIDPNQFGERASLDYIVPSHDGRYVAFGISENGDERSVLRVLDVEHAALLSEAIPHTKWTDIAWFEDGTGFYYRRYPFPGETHWNEQQPDSYDAHLFAHPLGGAPDKDPRVFEGEQAVDFPAPALDDTGRYLVVNNQRSWTASEVWLWDRGSRTTQTAGTSTKALTPNVTKPRAAAGTNPTIATTAARAEWRPILTGVDKRVYAQALRGELYITTDLDAPMQRVVKAPIAHAADRTRWQTVVPEADAAIEDSVLTQHFIVVHRIQDVSSKLELFTQDGQALGELPLPDAGSVKDLAGSIHSDHIAFVWSSFLHAPRLIDIDLTTRRQRTLYEVHHDFKTADYELKRTQVPSNDGTPINIYYCQRKGAQHHGQTPVLLYGYGGFSVSLLPSFSRSALYFLERGGIYAQATLRGGGEYGEHWHRAGMLQNKHKVFEDFESSIRWFSESGISNPNKIAITGGSNGGLLMGAMLTRAPQTFAAAASYVGLYDMLRFHKFPPADIWTSEYGDPDDPEAARYLLSYSPYHNLRKGTHYPTALIETADHDTRVSWIHSAKFAAQLQTATASQAPVYFYVEQAVGHGHGTATKDLVRRYTRQYAFIEHALGPVP